MLSKNVFCIIVEFFRQKYSLITFLFTYPSSNFHCFENLWIGELLNCWRHQISYFQQFVMDLGIKCLHCFFSFGMFQFQQTFHFFVWWQCPSFHIIVKKFNCKNRISFSNIITKFPWYQVDALPLVFVFARILYLSIVLFFFLTCWHGLCFWSF